MNNKNNKKGELSTQQIVLLIILIASFIIILLFLFRLNPGEELDKETCHQSVVLRGSKALPSNGIPLKCGTRYLCITEDGTCESLTKPDVERVKTEEDVYNILAEEMADCWWMFGEGEVDYVGKDIFQNLYCSICTQFVLDDSLKKIPAFKSGTVSEKEFYRYLENKEVPNKGVSYLEYITKISDGQALESFLSSENAGFKEYNLGDQYYVFMGIYSKISTVTWITLGAAAGVVLVVALPVGIGLASVVLLGGAGGAAGYYAGTTVEGFSGKSYLTPTIIRANSRDFDAFRCKNAVTSS